MTVDEATFPHLPANERGQLQYCLWEYARQFANGDFDLDSMDLVKHTIDTGDHSAIRQPPSTYPFHFIQESRGEDDKADGGAGGHPAIQ